MRSLPRLLPAALRFSALLLVSAASPSPAPDLVIVTDEAEAALGTSRPARLAARYPRRAWQALFATEGYRRLEARETGMGRSFEQAAFRSFLLSDSLLARTDSLRSTLAAWRKADLRAAGARALAYLPGNARLRARVYLLIKPRRQQLRIRGRAATRPSCSTWIPPAPGPSSRTPSPTSCITSATRPRALRARLDRRQQPRRWPGSG